MPAPLIATVGRAALHVLARAAAAKAKQRAAQGAWQWSRMLALGFGAATFVAVSLCSGIGAALQSSTLPWPVVVPEAGKEANGWLAGGWQVSSRYGWRRDPFDPQRQEFHDGIDLVGPPFCLHCRVPSLFDAQVRYLGWDPYSNRVQPADKAGGGMLVELETLADEQAGVPEGELIASLAHLAPYRLLVQLQGRIEDPWQREEFLPYADYRELGDELLAAPDAAALEITCSGEASGRVPEFVAQRAGPGTFVFLYDKPVVAPIECSVALTWPQRGDGWTGWIADEPGAGLQAHTAEVSFRTPIEEGVEAGDIAIRFRGHLVPPAPPATPTAQPYPAPGEPAPPYPAPATTLVPGSTASRISAAVAAGTTAEAASGCVHGAARVSCRWPLAAIKPAHSAAVTGALLSAAPPVARPARPAPASRAVDTPSSRQLPADDRCGRVQLLRVPARASDPRMTPDAAEAWHRADQLITDALGYAWLGVNPSDIMRPATHTPTKPNQILLSWHKTGRAVDVPRSGRGLRLVQEGAFQRLFVDGVDITALMIEAGFTRIASNPGREEWWHFEFKGGLTWQGAMAQVHPLSLLKRLYPMLDWSTFACYGDEPGTPDDGGAPLEHEAPYPTCTEGVPSWSVRYEELDGCGPPLTWSSKVHMLDWTIGHVGLTGATTGAHLHLGLRQRSGPSSYGTYPIIDVCQAPWLPEELRGKTPKEVRRIVFRIWKADCFTATVDPLDFLPRANAGPPLPLATAAPLDGAPAQLPPPGTDGALLKPVPAGEARAGEYWSPFGRYGRFGGGSVLDWLRSLVCSWLGDWAFFCASG